mgnify:CR=1 FL=1
MLAMWFSSNLAVAIKVKSGGNVLVEAIVLAAATPFAFNGMPAGWFTETNVGEALVFETSLAVLGRGALNYIEVP